MSTYALTSSHVYDKCFKKCEWRNIFENNLKELKKITLYDYKQIKKYHDLNSI